MTGSAFSDTFVSGEPKFRQVHLGIQPPTETTMSDTIASSQVTGSAPMTNQEVNTRGLTRCAWSSDAEQACDRKINPTRTHLKE
jgi:hypothetical protein